MNQELTERFEEVVTMVLALAHDTGRDPADIVSQVTAVVTRSGVAVGRVEHATLHDTTGVERRVVR